MRFCSSGSRRNIKDGEGLSEGGGVSATTSSVLPVRELGNTDLAQLPPGWVGWEVTSTV